MIKYVGLVTINSMVLISVFVFTQAPNVADSPELRDLLLYIGAELLADADLPHRTKLTELIRKRFKMEYQKIIEELKVYFKYILPRKHRPDHNSD